MSTISDYMPEMLDGAREFCDEVGFTFNPESAYEAIVHYDAANNSDVLPVIIDDTVAGAAIVTYDDTFQYERVGILVKFYIRKRYRSKGLGRVLMKKVIQWFDKKDCIHSEAFVSGGLDVDPLTYNLFRKFGYKNDGLRLRRYYNTI